MLLGQKEEKFKIILVPPSLKEWEMLRKAKHDIATGFPVVWFKR